MTKKYNNISISTFDCLAAKLKSQGLEMAGNSGYLSKNGISLDYAFDESAQTLTIENLEVGFPATMIGMNADKILGILEKAIEDCRG
ncbi:MULTISPECIES: hypothetical protein [Roseivirga]|uniref:hypothetical protein n=1 Tax=Roseivirga TaxID=290180 RepID=UPI00082C2F5D|nr:MULTISPECIES: hypothetical protein [Roseivirga]PWL29270.1 MAG: hypothetical protein DCO95_12610 [Roseivirga sp. XM-24bin3]MBO6662492.1 hypothetical protein [Roseivirga sp.]MBO6761126.1 hypothetical protein [Roseivirga sp.]MBO6909945.1 hypothetical protein [Roseivirga sp.]WPZ10713.1 hypothetical protein T7867_01205 [Roseivirga spongicola]